MQELTCIKAHCKCWNSRSNGCTAHHYSPSCYKFTEEDSPKEKTIEDVEVGDEVENEEYGVRKVLGICGKAIALKHFECDDVIWETIDGLKNCYWKIKQPEPEKKEWQQIFLEAGTKELGIDCSPLIKTVSDILSSK